MQSQNPDILKTESGETESSNVQKGDPSQLNESYERDIDKSVKQGGIDSTLLQSLLNLTKQSETVNNIEYVATMDLKVDRGEVLDDSEINRLIELTHLSVVGKERVFRILKENYENKPIDDLTEYDAVNIALVNQYAHQIENEEWKREIDSKLEKYIEKKDIPREIIEALEDELPSEVSYYEAIKGVREARKLLKNSHSYWEKMDPEEFEQEVEREKAWYVASVRDNISTDIMNQSTDPDKVAIMDGGGAPAKIIKWAKTGTQKAAETIPYATEGAVEVISEDLEELNHSVERVEEITEETNERSKDNKDRISNLEGSLEAYKKQSQEALEINDDIRERVVGVEKDLEKASEEREQIQEDIDNIESTLEEEFEEIKESVSHLGDIRKNMDKLHDEETS